MYGRGADQKEQLDVPTVSATLSGDKVTVNWNTVDNAEKYIVYRTSPTATKAEIAIVSSTSYEDAELTSSGRYTYYVVAVPKADSEYYMKSGYSKASNSITYSKQEPPTTKPLIEPDETTTPKPNTPEEITTKPQGTTEVSETTTGMATTTKQDIVATNNNPSVKNGSRFKVGKLVYKIKSTKKKTVSVVSTVNKKVKKVSIPKKVTYKKSFYKVVAIENKAFKNRKRLIKVTIGANIRTIGKKAFYNCKKLKKIIIRSKKLKKVGKQAFRKVRKKVFVKIPKKMKKKVQKIVKICYN